ncbi:hypothetical protein [Paenibacillus sp. sgz500958]|uniref:hypothetical protein n=1 Tax=Paenibacillus sp. sgz500958 TaxID=3242475 RepID=UPI0036D43A10
MKFQRKVLEYHNRTISVWIPEVIPDYLWFAEPIVDSRALFGNSEGYRFIRDLLLIAANHKTKDSMFYVPIPQRPHQSPYMSIPEMENWYKVGDFELDLVLFNYHFTQLTTKDVKTILSSLKYLPGVAFNIEPDQQLIRQHIEEWNRWKLKNTLNTKAHSQYLIISAEKEMLIHLAYQADSFTNIKDDSQHNYHAHTHADLLGTSKNNGLNFFYYLPAALE